jgi:peptidoglycan/xylan/chitin deacetylase (PgdA/CDA1 family)
LRASARTALARARRRGRRAFSDALGRPLAATLERAVRRSARRAGIALVYHRIADSPGDLDRELLPALAARLFEPQIHYLASRYRVVAASELPRALRERRPGDAFPVAITFDDDLRSHVDFAAPILERAGVTATFFLSGASLRNAHRFWWERLQEAVDQRLDLSAVGLPASGGIHELARTVESLPARELDAIDAALRDLVGPDPPDAGIRAEDVRRLSDAGFEIGFHTRRHYRLPALTDDELERAMHEGREELEDVVGRRLTTIAYPHGRGDGRVAAAARAAQFELGFTGVPAAVTPAAEALLLGRLSPSYDSLSELAFDLARTLVAVPSR